MFTSASAAETQRAGVLAAREIKPGDVIALVGDLGSGKTQFVKGLVQGLGCDCVVTSPTFTLVHEYAGGRLPIYHFDFYRLEDLEALKAIGFDEYIFGKGVSIIEWAERFAEAVPSNARWFYFQLVSETERRIAAK